jgi:hypothetical protein
MRRKAFVFAMSEDGKVVDVVLSGEVDISVNENEMHQFLQGEEVEGTVEVVLIEDQELCDKCSLLEAIDAFMGMDRLYDGTVAQDVIRRIFTQGVEFGAAFRKK